MAFGADTKIKISGVSGAIIVALITPEYLQKTLVLCENGREPSQTGKDHISVTGNIDPDMWTRREPTC